jgi:protein-S-isoprenylcysteine O-methyltransferase Ste14
MTALRVNQRARIHALQAGGIVLAAAVLLTQPVLAGRAHEFIEMAGLGLVALCIAGRMWSSLYIGARKNRELVTYGPYSITRNPLYFFSMIGAVGLGLIYGSVAAALGLGLIVYGIFTVTAKKEARHLRAVFGARYDAYARQTPFFWPNIFRYRDPSEIAFSPKALRRTFADSLLFLAAFPAIEAIEHLQAQGTLPILLRLI